MTDGGPKRIAVVGGGISGLSAAHRIVERDPGAEVVLFEGSARVGGLIYTERFSGYVIEHGPDAILTQKPWALDLAERLGLADQLVRTLPENAGAYVVHRGHLERIPDGFSLMAPTSLRALARTPLLSTRGKVRAALEWVLPSRPPAGDESLESFVVRRFGREIYDALAQPLVGGIYGADPSLLSLRATMPRFPDFERTHGSVVRGLRSQVSKDPSERASGARYGMFVSFRGGNGTLIERLAEILGSRIRLNHPIDRIEPAGAGWRVDGSPFDAVILALPSWKSAALVDPFDPVLRGRLLDIPYGSSATVTFAWPKTAIPRKLDAYGFVVPLAEGSPLLASTWMSAKWPGRAPADKALIRVFLGGAGHADVTTLSEARMIELAKEGLRDLLGVTAEPELVRANVLLRAAPHYLLGHVDRVREIRRRTSAHPGLFLAGNAYDGVGIPDSIHSGEQAGDLALGG